MMLSPALKSPRADLISEAARSFLEPTKKDPCRTESSAERNTQDCSGTIMVRKKTTSPGRWKPRSISALIRFWLAPRFRAARNASRAATPARYRGDRRHQAEEWLQRRQLPWRTYVWRAVAPPSQDDCRSGTARVHPRRGARHRLPCLRRARACRRDLCHQLTSPPRSGRYRRQRTHGAPWPPAAGGG